MADPRVERRLAAILVADVAGYSRLMGADEEGTLAALKACRRELIDPKIAEHRGRMVKTTGDGDEHTEGARDGHDPRNVRRCAQLGVRQANDTAVGPRQGRRPKIGRASCR